MPKRTQKTEADASCPWCREPMVYEPWGTGLMRYHRLPDGELQFLCPEDPHKKAAHWVPNQ